MAADDPFVLSDKGARIVARGGADGQTDDDMLLLEIASRVPGASKADLQAFFVAIRLEYGPDSLHAIRSGHVQFEKRAPQ